MSRCPLVALLAIATILVGCSSNGHNGVVSVATVAAATRSADSARIRLEVSYSEDALSTLTEGVVDFHSGDTRFEVHVGSRDEGNAVTITADGESFLGPKAQKGDSPSWIRIPAPKGNQVEPFAGLVLNPVALVDELKRPATSLKRTGSDEVHGDSTTTYRLDLRSGSRVLPLMMTMPNESVQATMDVDGEGRLRRLAVEPDEPTNGTGSEDAVRSPVPARAKLELWDFGGKVDVDKPEPHEVVDFDDPEAGKLIARILSVSDVSPDNAPESPAFGQPELSGPFTKVAEGTWEDVTWEFWEEPTTDGRVCHTFELDPPPTDHDLGNVPIAGQIEREGAPASCGPRADLFQVGDPVQLLGSWYAEADYWHMAGTVAPEISALDVELRTGRTIRVEVDPKNKIFTLFSREKLRVKEVRPNAGDKASIRCTPEEDDGFGLGFLNCSGSVHR